MIFQPLFKKEFGSVVEVREDSKLILVLNRSRWVVACGFGEAFLEGKVEKN